LNMKTGHKLLLAGAAAAGVGAYFYRQGINHLQFSVDGYVPGPDTGILMRIKVVNPSAVFGYPVPEMFVVVYDSNDNIVGTILNKQLQWIAANRVSYIYGTVQPNYQNLVNIITGLITSGGTLPTGLTFDGTIRVGRIQIPFTTDANLAGVIRTGNEIFEYKVSYGGKYYVTSDVDFTGQGITKVGDGSDHKRGLMTFLFTQAALKKHKPANAVYIDSDY